MSGDHTWWLASRASGVVALCLLSASVLLGLAMAARAAPVRPGGKPLLTAVHEQLSLGALIAMGAHALTLLGDAWLRPGLAGVAVPFAMDYRPVYTGLGIVAAYLSLALGPSFYARRLLGARRWRRAHRFTVVGYGLAAVHTLGAGTDAGAVWLRIVVLAPAAAALVLLVAVSARRGSPARPAPRRAPA